MLKPPVRAAESEARRKRDNTLRAQEEAIAEHLSQSMRSGELQSARSFGKLLATE
jgi:hypothetical protein